MIGCVAALPRNAEVAEQFELLADLLELEGAGVVPRARLPPRRDADARDVGLDRPARTRRARRRSCRGSARRSRRRSSRSSSRARSRRSTKRKGSVPPRSCSSCGCPGSGRRRRARIWKELGVTTLDGLKAAAEGEQLRALPGPRREERGEDPQGARVQGGRTRTRARRLLGDGLPAVQAVVSVLREHPAAVARLGGGLGAPAQGDVPGPRHHRHGDRSGAS